MGNNQRNIDLSRNGFPQRLRFLREASHLSQSDLAEKAGLTYRTVHDLESGKRKRSQEKTLILLAQALEVSLDELMAAKVPENPAPAVPPSRRFPLRITIGAAALAALALAAVMLWHQSCTRADWTIDHWQLVVKDKFLGLKIWEISGNGPQVNSCRVSPWNSRHLLVGTHRDTPGGGRLLCLDRASGDTIWTVGPDIQAMVRAFGATDVMSSGFSCKETLVADLDGDGTPEVIASFSHGKYYPFAICTVRPDGTLRAQYANKGHLTSVIVADIDRDGKDEIIGVGTNNNKAYMGATVLVLDDQHCNGASIDSLCNPWSSEPDSALVRIVLPNYPAAYMELMNGRQLCAFAPQIFAGDEGNKVISVVVRSDNPMDKITVFLDSELQPLRAQIDDSFLQYGISQWPDSMKTGVGPGDPDWLADWLSGYKRFEAGHRQPD